MKRRAAQWGWLGLASALVVGWGCPEPRPAGQDGAGPVSTPDAAADVAVDPGPELPPPADVPEPPADVAGDVEPDSHTPPVHVPLTLARVEPSTGSAGGFDQVELLGTAFRPGLMVFFGESVAQDVFILDDERIICLTPPRLPGLVDVKVSDPDSGETAILEDGFLFFNAVETVGVEPASGHVMGGEPVTIIGLGFRPGSNVLFGGRAAISIEVVDDHTIVCTTPDAPGPGAVDVHVSNDLGVGTLGDGFTYFEPPAISAVVPPVGAMTGLELVEVKGSGFVEPLVVSFGGAALEDVEVLGSDRLRGLTPPVTAPGAVDVLVSTVYGTAWSGSGFTYVEDLTPGQDVEILAVAPSSGPAAGGQIVTIVAKGLTETADTLVSFGGTKAQVLGVDAAGLTALVEVPEAPTGFVGAVDVTLSNGLGVATAVGAYEYLPFVKVYEIQPNFGPLAGGTDVKVSGVGFGPGLQLRVGALPASNVQVLDDHTATGTTPPGSPGLANVTVIQGALSNTLVGGFAYQSQMDLWVIDPADGSQAGGTHVDLFGSGFPEDAKVYVGGKAATHIQVLSPTQISAKTPPGELGTADVTVESVSKGVVTLAEGFTYYNPESLYGGTWGSQVEGAVNVTVLDASTGGGMADVFVMLWTEPDTPYQGYTNSQGQITFSGPDLMGEQMVSASKEGFASASVVEYDAENITLYLSPMTPPSPGMPPGVVAPVYFGQVVNTSKYVPVPWGNCASKPDAPGMLCQACATDAECGGPPLRCSDVPNQGTYCTSHCLNSTDCSDGFMCVPLPGVPEQQCVPSSGDVVAYCDFSSPSIWSPRDGHPGADVDPPLPGLLVTGDMAFEMTVPLGEFAVYCWGGILNPATGTFTPYALGVDRHVFAMPGDEIPGKVFLKHPLMSPMSIRLDDPPLNPNGPNFTYLFVHLDMGSDGTFQFLEHPAGFDANTELILERMPKALTGDLYDASYTIQAGAFSFSDDNLPYSMTLHDGIKSVEDDTMYVWAGDGWKAKATGVTKNINALAPVGGGTLLGVGSDGWIISSVGTGWGSHESGVSTHLRAVHGLPSGEAVAVGAGGVATHYDGLVWTVQPTATTSALEGVWMAAPDDVIAVGWYQVLRWDGATWSKMAGSTSKNLRGVWGFAADDVWAVGNYGSIIHWDGTTWSDMPVGTTQNLRAVWGAAPDDVWIVGEAGTVIHWDGTEMQPVDAGTLRTLEAVWGFAADDVYVVGGRGTILRWDGTQWLSDSPKGYDASFLAVAGVDGRIVASGTHELLLGPFIEVPENISPADGGMMGAAYELSWTVQEGVQPHFSYVEVAIPGMFGPVPEWTMINDWYVTSLLLPDFPDIEGTPGISPGTKFLTIIRTYREGFDINNYSYLDLSQSTWRSWAIDRVMFTKE